MKTSYSACIGDKSELMMRVRPAPWARHGLGLRPGETRSLEQLIECSPQAIEHVLLGLLERH